MPEFLPNPSLVGWQLCQWDEAHWGERKPPAVPPKNAEQSSDPSWVSLYVEERIVASWYRWIPQTESERRKIGERYQARRARGHR